MDSTNYNSMVRELETWNLGIVDQNSARLVKLIGNFVVKGSSLHQLNASEVVVYANIKGYFLGKQTSKDPLPDGREIADTVDGLMAAGAKFFDAIFYLGMNPKIRPKPLDHNFDETHKGEFNIPVYNDPSKLVRYLFSYYFFIMIRAHPPTETGDYQNQPMPKFISTVLAMKETSAEMAEYLAEFDLSKVDPGWVRLLETKGLSQEAASRMGLGVAGYRLPSIFNLIIPDLYEEGTVNGPELNTNNDKDEKGITEKGIKIKPDWFDDAIQVAKSFRLAGFCWDFHPATRNPNVLAKYGNINKNITNLILEAYKPETIKMMVQTKKLAKEPIYDPAYTNYKTWSEDMVYVATSKIFK